MNVFVSHNVTPSPEVEDSDLHLWSEVREGNQDALSVLYNKYVNLLYKYGIKMNAEGILIEDVIHDVFVAFWEGRDKIRIKVSLKYYLISSFRRKLVNVMKEQKQIHINTGYSELLQQTDSIEADIIKGQVGAETSLKLKKSISALTKKQREAIYLRYYENLEYHEISEIMGISLKHSYNLVSKAINCLKKDLF